ncbi:MAG: MATE family efflux transporter [Alphaproteobacteria bacterium]|jgi:MATE family multidrug resistance protein
MDAARIEAGTPAARRDAWRAEASATTRLALPIVATQLAQVSIMTVDVLFLGRLGPEALAAGALGWNLVFMVTIFGFGICMAAAPMMAQAIGRKRGQLRDVRRSMRQAFWASGLVALLGVALLSRSSWALALLGQDPAIVAVAADYVDALAWGLLPALWFMVLRQFTGALQRPRAALVAQLVALAVNVLGNWALIFGNLGMPALGVVGSGVATTIANWVSFLGLLGFVLVDRRMRRYSLLGRFWRADWPRLLELFRLGLPVAGVLLLEVALFSAAVYAIGAISTEQLAAHQIAIQCAAVTFMVPFGLAQAATVRVGLAAGAGDREGVRRAGWTPFFLGLAFMSATAVALWAWGRPIAGLFLDLSVPANAAVALVAVEFLAIAAVFQVFDGSQTIAMGALRGLKDTRVPMAFAALGYWVLGFTAGCVAAFPLGMGGLGVWIGLALGLGAVAILATARFAARERLGLVA